jgi:RNA polymerase primary sigma factor
MMALGEHGRTVRLPLNRLNTMRKIERTADALKQSLKREPSIEEIARDAEITMSEALNALMASTHDVSLDAPCRDDENLSLLNLLESDQHASPDASLLEESQHDEIGRLISALTPREAEVVGMYFGLDGNTPLTLEQIGERLQLTRERVRQIKEQALRRLRRLASWEMVQKYRNRSRDYENAQFFAAAA